MELRQVRAVVGGQDVVIAAVFDPWRRGKLKLAVDQDGVVAVQGGFGLDRWQVAVPDAANPATVVGTRDGKSLMP
jgi:hypothetical protein